MKNLKSLITYPLVFCIINSLIACATDPRTGKITWSSPGACVAAHTVGGVVLGTIAGAGVGAAVKGKQGAIVGAVAGGIAGGTLAFAYAWGKCFAAFTKIKSEQDKDYQQTSQELGYKPEQGSITKINNGMLVSSAVEPGGNLEFKGNYYIMIPPNENRKELIVTETAILKFYDDKKKQFVEACEGCRAEESVVVAPGMRKANTEVQVPDNAVEGKYMLAFMVTCDGKSDIVEMPFTITKDKNILAMAKQEAMTSNIAPKDDGQIKTPELQDQPSVIPQQTVMLEPEHGAKTAPIKTVMITASRIILHESPSTNSKKIGSAIKGQKYSWVDTKTVARRKWYQIKLENGNMAWVIGTAVKIVEE